MRCAACVFPSSCAIARCYRWLQNASIWNVGGKSFFGSSFGLHVSTCTIFLWLYIIIFSPICAGLGKGSRVAFAYGQLHGWLGFIGSCWF
jgi:hypothetical protein